MAIQRGLPGFRWRSEPFWKIKPTSRVSKSQWFGSRDAPLESGVQQANGTLLVVGLACRRINVARHGRLRRRPERCGWGPALGENGCAANVIGLVTLFKRSNPRPGRRSGGDEAGRQSHDDMADGRALFRALGRVCWSCWVHTYVKTPTRCIDPVLVPSGQ